MNAGYIAESVHVSSRILNKVSHAEHSYFGKELMICMQVNAFLLAL